MKTNARCFSLALLAVGGLLFASIQPATAFELFGRKLGDGAAQKCDACQKGASQKGACQKGGCDKGACQKGVTQKGGCEKGACQKGACQKGGCDKGACQKGTKPNLWSSYKQSRGSRTKLWGAHQKGATQKGGKGKGSVGSDKDGSHGTLDAGAPVPAPIINAESA